MKYNLTSKNIELTGSLKTKVNEKIVKQIKNLTEENAAWLDINLVDVFGPNKEGLDKKCSITLKLPGKTIIKIEETSDKIETAIELAKDRIDNALRKYKEKKREKRRYSKEGIRNMMARGIDVSMWPARATKKAINRVFKKKQK